MVSKTRIWEYDLAGFEETGVFRKVKKITGEVLDEGTMKPVFNKDRVYTAEQIEAWKNYKKTKEEKARRRDISKKYGRHFFVPRMYTFPDLKPQTVARLLYLLTYADYSERGNHLKRTQKQNMTKADLPKVLGLSVDAVNHLLAELSPEYITIDEHGVMSASSKVFHRGKIPTGKSYHRLYDTWVQSLYKNTAISKHKYLGYIFQLLPYINIKYNTLCFNPTEEAADHIEHMSLGAFCEKIHFNKSHANRLSKIYMQLRFQVIDDTGIHMERFVSITHDGLNRHNSKVFINPRILYSGAHPEKVELLADFRID